MLGVEFYSQFTSPIRRYLDQVSQRQLVSAIRGSEAAYSAEQIMGVARRVETRIRDLRRLENSRERFWLLKHFSTILGQEFDAILIDTGDRNGQVEILDYGFRGPMLLTHGGTPGEIVRLKLTHVDLWESTLRLQQV